MLFVVFFVYFWANKKDMPLSNIQGVTTFNLNASPKTLQFEDTTDYAGQGVNIANAVGCLTLTGPTGVFHNNTDFNNPDIVPDVDPEFFKNLPLNNQGNVVQGDYSVAYRVKQTNEFIGSITGDNTISIQGDYAAFFPAGTLINVTSGSSIGVYTSSGAVFNNGETTITTEEDNLVSENNVDFFTVTYVNKTYNFNFCYSTPTVEIEATVDCDCSKITSRDLTNYNITACGSTISPTSIARVHTVSAPNGQNGQPVAAPTITSLMSAVVTPIWTGVWTSTVITQLTYTLPSGLLVNMEVAGQDSYEASCAEGLCCVFQCMANLRNTYESFLTTNPTRAQEYFTKLFSMTTAWMLYSAASNCGDFANKKKYLNEIIDIAKSYNCDCCGESDKFPVEIIPVCGAVSGGNGNTVVVDTCGNGIIVSVNTVGTTTTYQVCLDLDVLNQNIANYITSNPGSLAGLSDVTLVGLNSGNVLQWNGTEWVNSVLSLSELFDVNIPSPTNGQVLSFDTGSGKWIATTLPVVFQKAYTIDSFVTTQTKTTSGAYTDLDISLPLATGNNPLSADGDVVEGETIFSVSGNVNGSSLGFALNGTQIGTPQFVGGNVKNARQVRCFVRLTRVSATQIHYAVSSDIFEENETAATNHGVFYFGTATVADITGTPLNIAPFYGLIPTGNAASCVYATYKSIKK